MIATHSQMMYLTLWPAARIPVDEDSPSGRLDSATAAMNARLGEPPCRNVTPIAADSGIPSSSAPRASAVPEAAAAPAAGATDILRFRAPARSIITSPTKNVRLPAAKPNAVAPNVPSWAASSTSS